MLKKLYLCYVAGPEAEAEVEESVLGDDVRAGAGETDGDGHALPPHRHHLRRPLPLRLPQGQCNPVSLNYLFCYL